MKKRLIAFVLLVTMMVSSLGDVSGFAFASADEKDLPAAPAQVEASAGEENALKGTAEHKGGGETAPQAQPAPQEAPGQAPAGGSDAPAQAAEGEAVTAAAVNPETPAEAPAHGESSDTAAQGENGETAAQGENSESVTQGENGEPAAQGETGEPVAHVEGGEPAAAQGAQSKPATQAEPSSDFLYPVNNEKGNSGEEQSDTPHPPAERAPSPQGEGFGEESGQPANESSFPQGEGFGEESGQPANEASLPQGEGFGGESGQAANVASSSQVEGFSGESGQTGDGEVSSDFLYPVNNEEENNGDKVNTKEGTKQEGNDQKQTTEPAVGEAEEESNQEEANETASEANGEAKQDEAESKSSEEPLQNDQLTNGEAKQDETASEANGEAKQDEAESKSSEEPLQNDQLTSDEAEQDETASEENGEAEQDEAESQTSDEPLQNDQQTNENNDEQNDEPGLTRMLSGASETVSQEPAMAMLAPAQNAATLQGTASLTANQTPQPSVLQQMINERLEALSGDLTGKVRIVLNKNITYDGTVTISAGEKTVADDFELELEAEDAGDDGMQADGSTSFIGNMVISGISVILKGLNLPGLVTLEGAKAKLDYYGTRADDGVNVTVKDSAEATIHTGEGADTVNATADSEGKLTIDTGAGTDTVSASVSDGSSANIETGKGEDTVNVSVSGADSQATVSTGTEADTVKATVAEGGDLTVMAGMDDDVIRAAISGGSSATLSGGEGDDRVDAKVTADSTATIETGTGDDNIGVIVAAGTQNIPESVSGSFITVNAGAGDDAVLISGAADGVAYDEESDPRRSIDVNLGSGNNKAEVDLSVADFAKQVDVKGGEGSDRLHVTGELDKDTNELLRATGTKESINLAGVRNSLNITTAGVETVTDSLENKRKKELNVNDGVQVDLGDSGIQLTFEIALPFTNYIYTGLSEAEAKHLIFNGILGLDPLMTNIIIAPDENKNLHIKDSTSITAAGLQLVLHGRTVTVDGTVSGGLVRIEAADGTDVESVQPAGLLAKIAGKDSYSLELLNISDVATVTIGKNANVFSKGDIIISSTVEQKGGIFNFSGLEYLNTVDLKIARATVDVQGHLHAGYKTEQETRGSVYISTSAKSTAGFDGNGNPVNGLPVAITLANMDSFINIAENATIEATDSIRLASNADLRIATRADSRTGTPLALAAAYVTVDSKVTVDGTLTADKGDVTVSATGNTEAETIADSGATSISGGYAGLAVIIQNVKADLGKTAKVTAGRDVNVKASAREKVETIATTDSVDATSGTATALDKTIDRATNFYHQAYAALTNAWESIKEVLLGNGEKEAADELDAAIQKVSVSEHSVQLDEYAKTKGDVAITSNNVNNEVTNTVTVTPLKGYEVKSVVWRGYDAGDTSYAFGSLEEVPGQPGVYSFKQSKQNVTVFVEYEEIETDETEDETVLKSNPFEDTDINNQIVVNDTFRRVTGGATDNYADDGEDPARLIPATDRTVKLTLPKVADGTILTYLTEKDGTSCLKKVAPGQELRLVANPAEGKRLKSGSLKVTYKVGSQSYSRTDVVNPDDHGRYLFTVPEDINVANGLQVQAEFVAEGDQDAEEAYSGAQIAGAVAITISENNNEAVISTTGEGFTKAEAGDVNVTAESVADIRNAADGTVITEGAVSTGEGTDGVTTTMGAGAALTVSSSHNRAKIKGTVIAGNDINVKADGEGSAKTESRAGYSAGVTGIGGGVSVQSAAIDSRALVYQNAVVQLDGTLNLNAENDAEFYLDADGSGSKRTAKDMGMGAGIAAAFDGANAVASVEDGATVTGKTHSYIGGLTLRADQRVNDHLSAAAGASSSGTSAMAAASLDFVNTYAEARLGNIKGEALNVKDQVTITANNIAKHELTAEGSVAGKGTGAGAALSLAMAQDEATATLAENLVVGHVQDANNTDSVQVKIHAANESAVHSVGIASASGGKVPFKITIGDDMLLKLINGVVWLASVDDTLPKKYADIWLKYHPQKLMPATSMSLSGAGGVNVLESTARAEIPDQVNVDVNGKLSVTSQNRTEAVAKGDASTTDSTYGIGAGLGLNMVTMDNIAFVGNGNIKAASLEVTATTKKKETSYDDVDLTDRSGKAAEDWLTDTIGDAVAEYTNDLVREIGLTDLLPRNIMDSIVNPVIDSATSEIIAMSGLKEMFTEGFADEVAKLVSDNTDTLKWMGIGALALMLETETLNLNNMIGAEKAQKVVDDFKSEFNKMLIVSIRDAVVHSVTSGSLISKPMTPVNDIVHDIVGYINKNLKNALKKLEKELIKDIARECGIEENMTDAQVDEMLAMMDTGKQMAVSAVNSTTAKAIFGVTAGTIVLMNLNDIVDEFGDQLVQDGIEAIDQQLSGTGIRIEDGVIGNLGKVAVLVGLKDEEEKYSVGDAIIKLAEEQNVMLTDDQKAVLRNPYDLLAEGEKASAGTHLIDTQSISGAGSTGTSVTGSAAVAKLDFTTKAQVGYDKIVLVNPENNDDYFFTKLKEKMDDEDADRPDDDIEDAAWDAYILSIMPGISDYLNAKRQKDSEYAEAVAAYKKDKKNIPEPDKKDYTLSVEVLKSYINSAKVESDADDDDWDDFYEDLLDAVNAYDKTYLKDVKAYKESIDANTKQLGEAINVDGDVVIAADSSRYVNNVASASLNGKGNASANGSAKDSANSDVGDSNAAQHVTEGNKVHMTTDVGATSSIANTSQKRPEIQITVKPGFELEKAKDGYYYANYSYNQSNDGTVEESNEEDRKETEVTGKVRLREKNGKLYIDPKDVPDVNDETELYFTLGTKEVLRELKIAEVNAQGVDVEAGAVTVEVKGRGLNEGGKLKARAGDTVVVTIQKKNGRLPDTISYSYRDQDGKPHEVKINPSIVTGKDYAFASVTENGDEYILSFYMPDADKNGVTVNASFIGNAENPSWMPNFSFKAGLRTRNLSGLGRGMGIGASTAMLMGSDDTVAMIGHRQRNTKLPKDQQEDNTFTGVTAGTLTITAKADHKEELASAAGTDPFSGETKANSITAMTLDASGAVDMLDTSVRATMEKLNKTSVTGYGSGSVASAGDVTMTATEISETNLAASAFSAGRGTAVGASLALNMAHYDAKVELGSIEATGKVTLAADSQSKDNTTAVASAVGADVIRILRAAGVEFDEDNDKDVNEKSADATEGKIGKTDQATETSESMQMVNDRLNQNRRENKAKDSTDTGEKTNGSLSMSSNALRSQGVRTDIPEERKSELDKDLDTLNTLAGLGLLAGAGYTSVKNFFCDSKFQIAASVGMTMANHTANVTVNNSVHAGDDVSITADNTANFATVGTSAAMSILLKATSVSGGAAVVDNKNEANVNILGDVVSGTKADPKGDITVKSTLTQNMDKDYIDKLAAQSVAGSVAGYDSTAAVGAAVSLVKSKAQTTVNIQEGEAGSDRQITGKNIDIEAVDQSRISTRSGGVSVSLGSTIGAGVALSMIKSGNTVSATVGKNTEINGTSFTLNAEKQEVTKENYYKNLLDMRSGDNDLISYSQKDGEGKEFNANVNLFGSKILKLYDGINQYSYQNNYAESIGASAVMTRGTISLGGSAAVVLSENDVKALIGDSVKLNVMKNGKDSGSVAVNATDRATNRLIAGGLSISPSSANVGVAVTVMLNNDTATASIGKNATFFAEGDLKQTSEVGGKTQAFSAGMSMAISAPKVKLDKNEKPVKDKDGNQVYEGASKAMAGAVNYIVNKAVATTVTGDNAKLIGGGETVLTSKANSDMMALAANSSTSIGFEGMAAGASVNIINDKTKANTAIGKKNTISGGSTDIGSDTESQLITGVASQSAQITGEGKAIAAGVNVNFAGAEATTTFANEGGTASSVSASKGDANIHANADAWALTAAASLPGGIGTALGGSVNVNFFDRTANTMLHSTAVKAQNGNIRIQSGGKDTSYMAGLLLEGSVIGSAFGGNAIYLTEDNDIRTQLDGASSVIAGKHALIETAFSDFTAAAVGSIALANASPAIGVTGIYITKTNNVITDLGDAKVTAHSAGAAIKNLLDESVTGVYVGANAKETQYAGAAGIALSGGFNLTGQTVTLINENTVRADASKATLTTEPDTSLNTSDIYYVYTDPSNGKNYYSYCPLSTFINNHVSKLIDGTYKKLTYKVDGVTYTVDKDNVERSLLPLYLDYLDHSGVHVYYMASNSNAGMEKRYSVKTFNKMIQDLADGKYKYVTYEIDNKQYQVHPDIVDISLVALTKSGWKYSKIIYEYTTSDGKTDARKGGMNSFTDLVHQLNTGELVSLTYTVDGTKYTVDKNNLQASLQPLMYNGDIAVKASDETKQVVLAGGLSFSLSAGIGASVTTVISGKTVEAKAHDMTASKDITVSADNKDDITQVSVNVGGSAGTAVKIGAAVQILKSKANAYVGSTVKATNGSFNLTSNNETTLRNAAVSMSAAGSGAVSPVGVVSYFKGESNAILGGNSVVNANGVVIKATGNKNIKQFTLGGAYSGSLGISGAVNLQISKEKTVAQAQKGSDINANGRSLKILAQSDYKLRAASAAVGASTAAIAVNAVVTLLRADTLAELAGKAYSENIIYVNASSNRDVIDTAATVGAGQVGVGVSVLTLTAGAKLNQDAADMLTYGNSGSKNVADKDKTFDASEFMNNIEDGGASEHYRDVMTGSSLEAELAGNGQNTSQTSVGHKDEKTGTGTFDGSSGYRSKDFDNGEYRDDVTVKGRGENMEGSDTKDIENAKNLNEYKYIGEPETVKDAVVARIADTAVISKGQVNLDAEEKNAVDLIGLTIAGGQVGVGITTAIAVLHSNVIGESYGTFSTNGNTIYIGAHSLAGTHDDDTTSAQRDAAINSATKNSADDVGSSAIRVLGIALGVGQVGVAVSSAVALTDNVTRAILGGNVQKTSTVTISAEHDYGKVLAASGALAAGQVGAAASVALAQANGEVTAAIDRGATVNTNKDNYAHTINVTTTSNVDVEAIAVTAGTGMVGINAGVALAKNTLQQNTLIGAGANVYANTYLNIKANADMNANAYLLGISVGGVAVSLNAGVADLNAKLNTSIGESLHGEKEPLPAYTKVEALWDIVVQNNVTTKVRPMIASLAAGSYAMEGNVLLAFNRTESVAKIDNASVKSDKGNISVLADLSAEAKSSMANVSLGVLGAAGLSVNYADLQSVNQAAISNSLIYAKKDLNIRAGSGGKNNSTVEAETFSGNMGAITVGLNAGIARNRAYNFATLVNDKDEEIKVDGNLNMSVDNTSTAKAGIKGYNYAVAKVAASTVVAMNDANSWINADLKRLTVAGDVNLTANQHGQTDTNIVTGGGSLFAADASVALAYGKTNSLIDFTVKRASNMSNLTAKNNASDTTTSDISNAAFDVIAAQVMYGAAYSKDIFNINVKLTGEANENHQDVQGSHTVNGNVNVLTDYSVKSKAVVAPSAGGMDISLGKISANVANARNTAYAGSNFEASKGTTTIHGDVTVNTKGAADTYSEIRSAKFIIAAINVGASIARSDLSMVQAATMRAGGEVTVDGAVDVQSVVKKISDEERIAQMRAEIKSISWGDWWDRVKKDPDLFKFEKDDGKEGFYTPLGGLGSLTDNEIKRLYAKIGSGHFEGESARATALVGTSGGDPDKENSKGQKMELTLIDAALNYAIANENMTSTAAVLGGAIRTDTKEALVDNGEWVTKTRTYEDVDVVDHYKFKYLKGKGLLKDMIIDPTEARGVKEGDDDFEDIGIEVFRDAILAKNGMTYINYNSNNINYATFIQSIIETSEDFEEYDNKSYWERIPIYTTYTEEYEEWVPKWETEYTEVDVYDIAKNHLTAASMNVYTGVEGDEETAALARSDGAKTFGFATAGNLKAKASANDSFMVMFEGMKADITGNANLTVKTQTHANAIGSSPGSLTVIDVDTASDARAQVGSGDDMQTVGVVIGEGATLNADNVKLSAKNQGYAKANMVKGNSYSLYQVQTSSIPTNSWYNNVITIGKDATVHGERSVEFYSNNYANAESLIDTNTVGLLLNFNKMKGTNYITQENNVDIGEGAKVTSPGTVFVTAETYTDANAKNTVSGGGVLSGNTAVAKNVIIRTARVNFARDALVDGNAGIRIRAYTGKDDNIRAVSYVGSHGGLATIGNARAYNEMENWAEIVIPEGVEIKSSNSIEVHARSTSYRDKDSETENDTGIYTEAHVSSGALIPLPNAVAKNTLKFHTYIDINQTSDNPSSFEVTAKRLKPEEWKYEKVKISWTEKDGKSYYGTFDMVKIGQMFDKLASGELTKLHINVDGGEIFAEEVGLVNAFYQLRTKSAEVNIQARYDVKLYADNERLTAVALSHAAGEGLAGVSNSTARHDMTLTNAVWIDNAKIKSRQIMIWAESGGKNQTGKDRNYANIHLTAISEANLKGPGKSVAEANITGTMINQIRTNDISKVKFNATKVIHKTNDPWASIVQNVKAKSKVLTILGIKLGITKEKEILKWYVWNRCDFCNEGDEYDLQRSEQETIESRYKAAFERAMLPVDTVSGQVKGLRKTLAPLQDINRTAAGANVFKARYGEEDNTAAAEIFVLNLPVLLKKDVRLNNEQLSKYRLWNNSALYTDVYMLPNSDRLYGVDQDGKIRLQYVTEVLIDDNGQNVEVITALTKNAFENPEIPIGSASKLNFKTGELTIPVDTDFEFNLDELSADWLIKQFSDGFFRMTAADADAANDYTKNGGDLPDGGIMEGLTEGKDAEGRIIYWLGDTPETAKDPDQTLIYLLVDPETDQVSAYRTTVNMLERSDPSVDVSLYVYRDADADRKETVKYDVMFFDTPEGEHSVIKILTGPVGEIDLAIPQALKVVLRKGSIEGTSMPTYSLSGNRFVMLDGTKGSASLFDGDYQITYDGDVFDSDYLRISGISTGDLNVMMKKDQAIWPEWTGENSATDIQDVDYIFVPEKNQWYYEDFVEKRISQNADAA